MGRKQTQPPVPATYISECFAARHDGQLIWRERPASHFPCRPEDHARFNGQRAGRPAGFKINGQHVVRFVYGGKTRRVALLKVAWIVATGELPKGAVRPRDGDERNAAPGNLIVTRFGARPSEPQPMRAKSLARRAEADMALIKAMSESPHAGIATLSALTGSPESCVSTRLGRLAAAGLAASPMCVPGRSWMLTEKGRGLAMTGRPLIDALDRRILHTLALASLRPGVLKQVLGVCALTVRRRVGALIDRGLVDAQDGRYAISDAGRAALGDQCPKPWLKPSKISASTARDVLARAHGWRRGEPDEEPAETIKRKSGRPPCGAASRHAAFA